MTLDRKLSSFDIAVKRGAAVDADIQATAGSIGTTEIADAAITEGNVADMAGTGGLGVMKVAQVVYDFSVDGGAISTIPLTGSPTLPDNAMVMAHLITVEVLTTFTSAGDSATIALKVPIDGDLITAVAIDDIVAPWDAGGHSNSATPIKLTDERALAVVVAVEAVTAGKAVFHVPYIVSQ